MTIEALVTMAQRIHDAEGWRLGTGSSRETRNEFWARVIGCAHHGHPTYNSAPDPQWHLKSGGGARPQSDDVTVSMPSRAYWDCIAGVGADGYRFVASGHAEPLPSEQPVFPPPVPQAGPAPGPTPIPAPNPTTCQYQPTDLGPVLAAVAHLQEIVIDASTAALRAEDAAKAAERRANEAALVAENISERLANGLTIVEGRAGWAGAMSGKVKG